jgi:CheY-like chemotaxis protein
MTTESILIVEDEAIISSDLKDILQQHGYRVTGRVKSGAEAIELAQRNPPDTIIMDIHLQGRLDGIQTALEIQNQCGRQIHFVFLSAYPQQSNRFESIRSWAYVKKVWTAENLIAAVKKRKINTKGQDIQLSDLLL